MSKQIKFPVKPIGDGFVADAKGEKFYECNSLKLFGFSEAEADEICHLVADKLNQDFSGEVPDLSKPSEEKIEATATEEVSMNTKPCPRCNSTEAIISAKNVMVKEEIVAMYTARCSSCGMSGGEEGIIPINKDQALEVLENYYLDWTKLNGIGGITEECPGCLQQKDSGEINTFGGICEPCRMELKQRKEKAKK